MTQAFNLSQLANNVNTAGKLNAAAGLYNQVPVANGGTGVASFTGNAAIISNAPGTGLSAVAAGTSGNVLTSDGTTWISQTASGGTPIVRIYTSPSPWTKPATLKAVKVTVVAGGGGGGGRNAPLSLAGGGGGSGAVAFGYLPATVSIPGPQTVTVGTAGAGVANATGTAGNPSSFGALVSCTGGGAGTLAPSPGGVGTGGAGGTMTTSSQVYGSPGITGAHGQASSAPSPSTYALGLGVGTGGASAFGFGFGGSANAGSTQVGLPATGYGAGGAGAPNAAPSALTLIGTNGSAGIVIVEEFY